MPFCHEIDAAQCRPHADRPFLLARSRPTFLRIVRKASSSRRLSSRGLRRRPRILCIRYARPMGDGVRLPRAPEIFALWTIHVDCYVHCSVAKKASPMTLSTRKPITTEQNPTATENTPLCQCSSYGEEAANTCPAGFQFLTEKN